ncbi:MAG: aminotransferase class V-fold PLP-dependent enzyme [Planctomycetes bacterium]|nr:aminotransferase class V-fold PLP-dependent enzyme [Planctomycetota bacterium]
MTHAPPIYLDYNATTPVDPRVLEAMLPFFCDRFGNAASRHHALGCDAAKAVEAAREQVAAILNADPREIVWTSGATESDNLAVKGVAAAPAYAGRGNHLVTVATEHRAVLEPSEYLEGKGCRVTVLPVDSGGHVDLRRLADSLTDRTLLVSVMHANNELGVLHPIREIGALCKARGVLFHTDATQSFGKEPIDVDAMGIDLLSASAHKFCGPKGVGFLYVRRRDPRVRLEALLHGGGHEKGVRSGTLNVPGIVGLGAAAALCRTEGSAEQARIGVLRDRLERGLLSGLEDVRVNGDPATRLAGTTNLSFGGVDGEELMESVPELAVSSSSACTSALAQPSYVLGALGCDEARIRGSVRFSLGRFTTEAEIDAAIARVMEAVKSLRVAAPGHAARDEGQA